jgi:hypothetical protein
MNWRRGLFRLWVIGTVLFVMAVAMVAYDDIKTVIAYGDIKRDFDAAKAEFRAAVSKSEAGQPMAGDWAPTPPTPTDRKLATDRLATLNTMENAMFYADGAWANVKYLASIAIGIPLAVLALGASLVWAFSGFSAKQP